MSDNSKQAGKKLRHAYQGHHEEEIGCLPKYNYSTGFGYRCRKGSTSMLTKWDAIHTPPGGTQKQGRSVH
jgi:hypothetical protein